jgi:Mannosylglycerate hydrolase MGH1-like glycoside hydrolase domain
MGAERDRVAGFGRLEDGLLEAGEWYRWGPYLSERQWGTVREDYSSDGNAWDHLPHEQARSRAYRWGEDGLAGFSDIHQRLCLALALWNGRDPILKERAFGLTGPQGNHGEDVKEYWWYLDAIPSHAWNRWRYHYPQAAFPYQDLIDTNARRNRYEPEYELLDTSAFDADRYWITEVHYAKASPDDLLISIQLTNAGPEADTVHVLPQAWFRNTWSWGDKTPRPVLRASGDRSVKVDHPIVGAMELIGAAGPDGAGPQLLFCENDTNLPLLYGCDPLTLYPKDGINDHVIHGAPTVNPALEGTKCAFWYRITVAPGQTAELRLRLRPTATKRGKRATSKADPLADEFEQVMAERKAEADEFYAELTPTSATEDEALVLRQASAGMLWSKQLFVYDVARWLDGDPGQPPPPEARKTGRNSKWRSFDAFDIISMPDKWEYPWFAAWDLAFHTVPLAHLDPAFAKYQLILVCREWFQHPNGALPAYEWDFGDVNPPVHAWAALQVFAIDGGRDLAFLSRVFDKLLLNFTWWVNMEDRGGDNVFEGGFLGLDNIGPIDRSHLPPGYLLEQSDATGWMGSYALALGTIAAILNWSGEREAQDLVLKFLEHAASIRAALDRQGLWDDADGMFYDRLITPSGSAVPVRTRSMVGIIPVLASIVVDGTALQQAMSMNKSFMQFLHREGVDDIEKLAETPQLRGEAGSERLLLSVARPPQLERLFAKLFDENEFLSPHGLRALSAYHRDHPYQFDAEGYQSSIAYEPAESTTPMFGGNSNWRGPIWMPVNYLVIEALERYARFYGSEMQLEYPTGSGELSTLDSIIADLRDRLISLFVEDQHGRRACFGGTEKMQTDPAWHDNLIFSEYFHGDNGAAIGAFHQTGWTGLIADVILRRHGATKSIGDVARELRTKARS